MSGRHVERMPARRYYGRHATGVVVLVNGRPMHFTGEDASREAGKFVASLSAGENQPGSARC